jgi:hypothetical protein
VSPSLALSPGRCEHAKTAMEWAATKSPRPRLLRLNPEMLRDMAGLSAQLHCLWAPPGRRTVNTEPLPGSLVTVTSPPIMREELAREGKAEPRAAIAARS